MLADSTPHSAPFRHENPLRHLAQIAFQVQAEARDLVGYELLLGEENIAYVHEGAQSMAGTVQNLMRNSEDDENPLLSQDIRHDLRNQVAVVKGFSDLMKMDLPEGHSAENMLDHMTQMTRNFIDVLDSIKYTSEAIEPQHLSMAS